jgi:hypothetical protein
MDQFGKNLPFSGFLNLVLNTVQDPFDEKWACRMASKNTRQNTVEINT